MTQHAHGQYNDSDPDSPNDKVLPRRGDWFQSKGPWTKIVCREYTAPPPWGVLLGDLPRRAWFGPVHEVIDKEYRSFVVVKVPSRFMPGELAWVNIENRGTRFAKMDRCWAGFLDLPVGKVTNRRGGQERALIEEEGYHAVG